MKSRIVAIGLLLFSIPCWAMQHFVELGWVDSTSPIYQQMMNPQITEQVYRRHDDQRLWRDMASANRFEDQLEVMRRAGF
ncbi:MAG: hypothetical protein ACRDCT_06550, partial [Shewanella sp.]